ncbi:MAG: BlaI/MecI/CopY family transcriptional regulator, partial [Saprospiraceae bacterium]
LQVLWQHGSQTVRFVNDELNKIRNDVGYTTTLKIMQNMLDKGILRREIIDRSHIYSPVMPESMTQKQLLEEFLDSTYRGSAASLVIQALGHGKTTREELEKIKALIQNIENNK